MESTGLTLEPSGGSPGSTTIRAIPSSAIGTALLNHLSSQHVVASLASLGQLPLYRSNPPGQAELAVASQMSKYLRAPAPAALNLQPRQQQPAPAAHNLQPQQQQPAPVALNLQARIKQLVTSARAPSPRVKNFAVGSAQVVKTM